MRFALLGIDRDVIRLAEAIERSNHHQLLWYTGDRQRPPSGGAQSSIDAMHQALPAVRFVDDWESELIANSVDAVVLGYDQDSTNQIARIRKLIATQHPVILSHPVSDSILTHYEIELLSVDHDAIVIPVSPWMGHPALVALAEILQDSKHVTDASSVSAGIQQLGLERTGVRSDDVVRCFEQDAALVRQLAGDIVDVAAMSARNSPGMLLPLQVQMSGASGCLVRWSASEEQSGDLTAKLLITAGDSPITLTIRPAGQSWIDAPGKDGKSQPKSWTADEVAEGHLSSLVDDLQKARAGGERRPRWRDVTRSYEVGEALERSLKKGRLVHLNYEGRGETSAFKGTMASLGCGILVFGLLLFVAVAVILRLAKVHQMDRFAGIVAKAPYFLLALMLVFLFLQLLRFVIPVRNEEE